MMLLQRRTGWATLTSFALFWIVAYHVDRLVLFSIANSIAVSVGVGLVVLFSRSVWYAYRSRIRFGPHFIVLGIFYTWLGATGIFVIRELWRVWGRQDWIVDSLLAAFFIWMMIMGGLHHMIGHDALTKDLPTRNYIYTAVAIAIGTFVGLLFVWIIPRIQAA